MLPALKQDSVENYSKQLCQWILFLLSFKDAIKIGDLTRTNIHPKMLIFFYSHSKLSQYYEDYLDYILKTFAEQVGKHHKRKHRTAEMDEKVLGNYMRNFKKIKNKKEKYGFIHWPLKSL